MNKVSVIKKNLPGKTSVLLNKLTSLIEQNKQHVTSQVNSSLNILFWQIGNSINEHILRQRRADYGKQIVVTVSRQLLKKYGSNFEEKNLRRMLQFAEQFPDIKKVVTLSRQLSWSHILILLTLKNMESKLFYTEKTITELWSVRELRKNIETKSFERTSIANIQFKKSKPIPADIFKEMELWLPNIGRSYLQKKS